MSKIYSVAELQALDTEELQANLEEYMDQADDDEFDYVYVKRITDYCGTRSQSGLCGGSQTGS